MESKERIQWIDFVKGIAILSVVWKHIKWEPDYFGKIICAFHMHIFFIITGILLYVKNDLNKTTSKNFMKKKASALLYPYVIFSVLSILILLMRHRFVIENLIDTIILTGYSALWFLPCLFFSESLSYVLLKNKQKRFVLVMGVAGILLVSIFGKNFFRDIVENKWILSILINITRICTSSVFILLGYFGYKFIKDEAKCDNVVIAIFLMICGISLALLNNGEVGLKDNNLYNPIFFYLSANMICWGIIILCKKIKSANSLICYWGKNSLIILVTHIPMSIVSIVKWKIPVTTHIYIVDCVIVFVVVMIIESILIYAINRWAKFLIRFPKIN